MRVTVSCLLALLLAAPGPAAAEQPTSDELLPLFDALQRAAREGERGSIAKLFDTQRTIEVLRESGFLHGLPEPIRLRVEGALTLGLPMALSTQDVVDPFERFEIRRVRPGEAPGHYRVYVRHHGGDGMLSKILWSVVKTGDAYRIYDFEDLELGVSFAQLIGASTAAVIDGAEDFRLGVQAILGARDQMLAGDSEGALARLRATQDESVPAAFRGLKHMMIGALLIDAGEEEQGLEAIGKARSLKKDAPVLAYLEAMAHNNLAQHERAFARAKAYIEALDGDPGIWVELARAHAGLLRLEQALLVLEQALEEDPDNTDALAWYATFLPADRKSEAVKRILALPELERDVERIAEHILSREDGETLEILARAYAERQPTHPDGPFYLGHALELRGDESEAPVEAFRRAMRLGAAHRHAGVYMDAWCDVMLERGRALEGYAEATDKVHVFDYLAWDLAFGEHADTLRRLALAAAVDLGAGDPGVLFFQAEADQLEAQYEKVIARLDGAHAGLRAREAELDERSKDFMWQIEDRLVRAYVRLERFEEALAVARTAYAKDADPRYLALVYARSGETEKALKALTECLESGDYLAADLFEDEDMAEALRGEAYRALRAKHYDRR